MKVARRWAAVLILAGLVQVLGPGAAGAADPQLSVNSGPTAILATNPSQPGNFIPVQPPLDGAPRGQEFMFPAARHLNIAARDGNPAPGSGSGSPQGAFKQFIPGVIQQPFTGGFIVPTGAAIKIGLGSPGALDLRDGCLTPNK